MKAVRQIGEKILQNSRMGDEREYERMKKTPSDIWKDGAIGIEGLETNR